LSVLDAVLLAILQGFTEFLPVSSSGHLVIVQQLLHLNDPRILMFDVFVHFGTLISIVVLFWKDIIEILRSFIGALAHLRLAEEYRKSEFFRTGLAIVVGSIPAAVIGLKFHRQVEDTFTDPKLVAMNLVITGLILFLTRLARPKEGKQIGAVSALIIGMAQAVAILPGISRSGLTMSAAIFLKNSPVRAARFSFLLSVPVIFGAFLLETGEIVKYGSNIGTLPFIMGTGTAAVAGYFAMKLLLRIMEKGRFSWFSVYCLAIGILGIVFI
jgi:undecaprenyl-diphosphatase